MGFVARSPRTRLLGWRGWRRGTLSWSRSSPVRRRAADPASENLVGLPIAPRRSFYILVFVIAPVATALAAIVSRIALRRPIGWQYKGIGSFPARSLDSSAVVFDRGIGGRGTRRRIHRGLLVGRNSASSRRPAPPMASMRPTDRNAPAHRHHNKPGRPGREGRNLRGRWTAERSRSVPALLREGSIRVYAGRGRR